jgi:hypothetical protein
MRDQIYSGWLQENGKKIKSYRKWQLRHIKLSSASPKRKRMRLNRAKEKHVDLQNLPIREVQVGLQRHLWRARG